MARLVFTAGLLVSCFSFLVCLKVESHVIIVSSKIVSLNWYVNYSQNTSLAGGHRTPHHRGWRYVFVSLAGGHRTPPHHRGWRYILVTVTVLIVFFCRFAIFLEVYQLFMWLWVMNFIIGLGQMTLAGSFGSYYWAFDKSKDIPMFPVTSSLGRCLRYGAGGYVSEFIGEHIANRMFWNIGITLMNGIWIICSFECNRSLAVKVIIPTLW
jgi:Plasma-membrane choline transporter